MNIKSAFDSTIKTLQNSLNVRSRKHEVIVSNIANADTPNYKAMELIVSKELSGAEYSNRERKLITTHPDHFSAKTEGSPMIRVKQVRLSKEVTLRGDGNTVNLEKEMAELSENNLMYRATSDIISKKFQGLIKAIQGGRRS